MASHGELQIKANQQDITQDLSLFFPGEARPPTEVMVVFVDQHKAQHGVEPICKKIQIAPSNDYERKARERNFDRLPDRLKRDKLPEC